jgi:hypothetical protein
VEAEIQVDRLVKCQFSLSHFNPNWSISMKFSKTAEYHIRLQRVEQFWSCFMHADRRKEISIGSPRGYECGKCSLNSGSILN